MEHQTMCRECGKYTADTGFLCIACAAPVCAECCNTFEDYCAAFPYATRQDNSIVARYSCRKCLEGDM